MSAQFSIKAADPCAVAALQQALSLPRIVAATLVARGITEPTEACRFMHPSLDTDWLNPYDIPGMEDVVDALEGAVRRGERILVFGDFDVDGITATTVLTRGLRALGADAVPFIPRRFDEGYALSDAALKRACECNPRFIVTVDCGISCGKEAAEIVASGLGLAITDHHEPGDSVPEGVPLADPKCAEGCESAVLAGAGVALKVVQALGSRLGQPHLWREFTDFAAMGTVADLMPMEGENRALVHDGIDRLNHATRPCIAALLASSGNAGKELTATNLSFSLIPRLNASGRMGDAQVAVDLLMTDDFEEATRLAQQLESINDARRSIESELSELAREQAAQVYHGQRALIVAGEGWHEGVKGIVASRLVNDYGVPALLFTIVGDEARGSGRSVGQINLFRAVESCSHLLTRFGGHQAAVGITLPKENLPEFERCLCEFLDQLPEQAFHPLVSVDACVSLPELTLDAVAQVDGLAPFGQGFPVPVYLAQNVMLTNCRAVGAEKNHFSCALTDGRATVSGIMFHCTDIAALMGTDAVVNAAFEVQVDEWRGRRTVKAMLQSIAPARRCEALNACLSACQSGQDLSYVADLYAASDAELCSDVHPSPDQVEAYEETLQRNREFWKRKAAEDPGCLQSEIIRSIIGEDGQLHGAQQSILDNLAQGISTLGIMATGRGKSLTFQVHAARCALAEGMASLFVYPLRALIADQAFHLSEAVEAFGVSVSVLTGESTPEERRAIYRSLAEGSCDIVLTTPEYLQWHGDELAESGRVGFVVIDEAHHIGLARAGQRTAYATIGTAVQKLARGFETKHPGRTLTVLALTATADDAVCDAIRRELPVEACVFDRTDRPNLTVNDQRNLRNRDDYLVNLVASGQKTVIYVNSREQSVAVARMLRRRLPHMALQVGFYNAGLTRVERKRIETLFRTDALRVLVATSAFGEGVNIPNIRNVVLYHMPFNEIEFNQMSGRAGRDGQPATIHLLYGRADCSINEGILREATPDRDCMAQVYRQLRNRQRASLEPFFPLSADELAQQASSVIAPVSKASVDCGVAVFRELGLIETHTAYADGVRVRSVHVREGSSKVALTDSVRYREGLEEREIFQLFRRWALDTDAASVRVKLISPILPSLGFAEGESGVRGGSAHGGNDSATTPRQREE